MTYVPPLKHIRLDDPAAKRTFNRIHFAEAAQHYDRVTRLLSLGRDDAWKKILVDTLPDGCLNALDLACGTGDICFLLARRYAELRITGIDLTPEMLRVADARNTFGPRICFLEGDLCALPAADRSFDLVTGAYALRNAPELRTAVREIYRVLTPGGTAAFLDFSKSPFRLLQVIQYHLLRIWGGLWGWILHGNPSVHGYIAASLKGYPDRRELARLFEAEGFSILSTRRFYGGMMELVILRKPPGECTNGSG